MIKILKTSSTRNHRRARKAAFMFMSASAFVLILVNPEKSIEYMSYGLDLCAKVVIPSLFPFMIISSLLVESGVGEFLGKLLAKPMKYLFGISGNSASAVILGNLCGFPVGAQTVSNLLDKGYIGRREAEKVLTFVNNPSSAFVISAVGLSLWSNKKFGSILYFICILSSFIVALTVKFIIKPGDSHDKVPREVKKALSVTSFTSRVSSSAISIIVVCAYVTFFSAITGSLSFILSSAGVSREINSFIISLTELSSGVSVLSSLDSKLLAAILTAFALGWSGISVHCQVMSMFKGQNISFKPYVIAKFFQGILCVLLLSAYIKFIDSSILFPAKDVSYPVFLFAEEYTGATLIAFAFICAALFIGYLRKKTRSLWKKTK